MLLLRLAFLSLLSLACGRLTPEDQLSSTRLERLRPRLSRKLTQINGWEKEGLLAFRATMTRANESLPSWDPTTEPCSAWSGLTCDSGRVVALELNDLPQLSPRLVPELSNLGALTTLRIQNVGLRGKLPPELCFIGPLQILDLSNNKLSGPIPKEIGSSKALRTLNLRQNRLNGSFPLQLTYLTELQDLDLSRNSLRGLLPGGISGMVSLMYLNLAFNGFSGGIPEELNRLQTLGVLYLNGNNFGSMPSDFSPMSALTVLDLSGNKIRGSFPSSLFSLANLSIVNLFNNLLTGPLPLSSPLLQNVLLEPMNRQLDFSFNYLQGNTTPPGFLQTAFSYNCFGSNFSRVMFLPGQRNASSCLKQYQRPSLCDCPIPLLFSPDGSCNCTLPLKFKLVFTSLKLMPIASITFNNQLPNITAQLAVQLAKESTQIVLDAPLFKPADNSTTVVLPGSILPLQGNRFSEDDVRKLNGLNGSALGFTVPFFLDAATLNVWEVSVSDGPTTTLPAPPETPPEPPSSPKDSPSGTSRPKSTTMGYGTGMFIALIIIAVALACATIIVMWLLLLYCRRRGSYNKDLSAILPESDDDKKRLTTRSQRRTLSRGRNRKTGAALPEENPLLDMTHPMRRFAYAELEDATAGFDESRRLGSGGFGAVYRGILPDGTPVAVKVLAADSVQGDKEFRNEVQIIGTVHNRHVVSLVGYCMDEEDRILVYEYVPNGSLEDAIFNCKYPVKLGWDQCVVIFEGTARGITYLHQECKFKIIHRDIKPGNVLLDDDFEARVSDFGLARNTVVADSHVTTRVVGTLGYMAPEYSATGQLTEKSDVYSFGVLMLVVLSGRKPTGMDPPGSVSTGLVQCAFMAYYENRLLSLIGTRFEGQYSRTEAERLLFIALLCAHPEPQVRPTMGQVVNFLTTSTEIPRVPVLVPYTVAEPSACTPTPSEVPAEAEAFREAVGQPDSQSDPLSSASNKKPSLVSRCQTWSHTVFPDAMLVRRSFNRLPSSPPRLADTSL